MNTFWSTRSEADAAAYWETRAAGYRGLLASMLRPFAPFRSVLEIGAHSGPNLWAIRQQFPDVHLLGLEPSTACAAYGQRVAVAEAMDRMTPAARRDFEAKAEASGEVPSVGVDFFEGRAPGGLQRFHAIDVVISCYTLAYLSPAACLQTLEAIRRIATRGVLLVEPMPTADVPAGPIEGARIPATRHDYLGWWQAQAPDWGVESLPFPGPQGLNRAVRVRRV